MIDEPRIVHTGAVQIALIHVAGPRDKIQEVMGPGLGELMDALKAQGVTAAGPWFTHHLKMDPEIFDFEICVPVQAPVRAAGRVQPGELRATRVARTIYHGPYEGLPEAWREFEEWIKKTGDTPADDLWEVYATGPESSPDPAEWRTELNQPLT
jgi:effector-binding domain-containing protein